MNLLKKPEGLEIYFYDEDNQKDATSLRVALEEFLEYFHNSSLHIKFIELKSLRLEALSLILSFTKELKKQGSTCVWTCPDPLYNQLVELGIGKFIELNREHK